jgi:hypothetical protein
MTTLMMATSPVKVANTLDDAVKLMEVGFEFHAEIEGNKLFRKRK